MRAKTSPETHFFVAFALCIGGTLSVQAVENSAPVPPFVGHKPTADNVVIDNPAPVVGDTLTVNYDYGDADGDAEDTPGVKWFYNDRRVTGQAATTYTPELKTNTGSGNACTGFLVTAEVTPQSQTGDPSVGDAKISTSVLVTLPTVPGFTFPDTVRRKWADADDFCRGKGMQLPTRAQLQHVFNTYTTGGTNYLMAEKYGWPLVHRCGGDATGQYWRYWTREVYNVASSWLIDMTNGTEVRESRSANRAVTCVR